MPKSTDLSGNPGGFNLLNIPDDIYSKLKGDDFWNLYNQPFLDKAIARGDEILLATPIIDENLDSNIFDAFGKPLRAGYGKEYDYLLKNGYKYVDGKMIKK
jgi:hypothetical protein